MVARTTLIADIGDVLITTRPGAHYRIRRVTDRSHRR